MNDECSRPSAYGMTELLFATMDPVSGLKLGYTGQLLPTLEAKVLDVKTREPLPPYKDGEIVIKSVCVSFC